MPLARGLLGAVHASDEFEDVAWAMLAGISGGDLDENVLGHLSVEERRVEVELLGDEPFGGGVGKGEADGRHPSDWCEGLVDINAWSLSKSLSNEVSFEATVGFDRVNPCRSKSFGARGKL